MTNVQAYLVDGVHIRIRPANNLGSEWLLALAKREPFILSGAQPMHEPGEVWFQYGTNPADLVDLLVSEVKADQ